MRTRKALPASPVLPAGLSADLEWLASARPDLLERLAVQLSSVRVLLTSQQYAGWRKDVAAKEAGGAARDQEP